MTIEQKQKEIVRRFERMNEWFEKYEYLIGLARAWPSMEPHYRTKQNSIADCRSRVWIHSQIVDEAVRYQIDSDSLIIRGVLALLAGVLDGHSPEEIVSARFDVLERTGLDTAISPSRAIGLEAMVKRLQTVDTRS